MIDYTGAGLMTLITLIIVIGVGTLLYMSSASHPDAGTDPSHWVMRQVDMNTGKVRYVSTMTSDEETALGMAESVNFAKGGHWYCIGIIQYDHLLD